MELHIELEREEDGRWIADVAALPGVMALAFRVLADRIEHGEPVLDSGRERLPGGCMCSPKTSNARPKTLSTRRLASSRDLSRKRPCVQRGVISKICHGSNWHDQKRSM